jgi:hypothetical protein
MSQPAPLHFALTRHADSMRPLTRYLQILVDGHPVWPAMGEVEAALEIQSDDLLSYLTEHWKPLLLRQVYPVVETIGRPSDLLRAVSDRWDELPEALADNEADEVARFEEAHNLATAFGGLFELPPAWLVRDGNEMVCEFGNQLYRLPFAEVQTELARVGDEIASTLDATSPKWTGLIHAWRERDIGEASSLLAWSAGLDREVASDLLSQGKLDPPLSVTEAANDNDPLRIAARLAGGLPHNQISAVIDLARSFAGHSASELDRLTDACIKRLEALPRACKPFEQGEAAATEARISLGIPPFQRIDIVTLMGELGIELRMGEFAPKTLEGLAIAGGAYGPGAFVNLAAERVCRYEQDAPDNPAVRVTLAHELCHLALDREHAMSAVEILQSRMSRNVEARARAFAGEFLLPSASAARVWDLAGSPVDQIGLESVLRELADDFGVSISVAAWKLEHGAWGAPPLLRSMLSLIAPRR